MKNILLGILVATLAYTFTDISVATSLIIAAAVAGTINLMFFIKKLVSNPQIPENWYC